MKRSLPAEWKQAYLALKAKQCPPGIKMEFWQNIQEFNYHLFRSWIFRIIDNNWNLYEIFGCCKDGPFNVYNRMGLILGSSMWQREIILVNDELIKTKNIISGAILSYRRKPDKKEIKDLQFIWEI